jgi:lysophospholipase L1-like esterase
MRACLDVSQGRSRFVVWLVAGATSLGCPADRNGSAGSGGTSSGSGGSAATGGAGGATGSTASDAAADSGVVAAGVRWIGRVDAADASGPRFAWSGTGFAARFSGTSISVNLKNDDAYFFQAVIDGKKGERFRAVKGQAARTVATGLAAGTHTLEIYREIEASYGTSQFLGIGEATLLAPPPPAARQIEFIGDSITAGYGNLGNEPHPNHGNPSPCSFTFDTQSAYVSYGAVAARALGAEASIIAASGWGVYRSRTSDMDEVLPKVYANTLGMNGTPAWDFRVKPNAVVINLGANDFEPGDPGTAYTNALGAFADTVREKNPTAWIFLAVGPMYTTQQHGKARAYAQSIAGSRGGDASRIATVDLGSQDALLGTGCDWHPSAAEDQRMADVLVPVMKQKLGW